MDKGAHFYRCDFQVHSPRDLNWNGQRPISDTDRKAYAERFIAACRTKHLDAVAITDHHDTVFFRYVKEAAENELDDQGNPVPQQNQIVVFPGMELTLGVPCQALLLLDASFPISFLSALPSVFAVAQADASQAMHIQTTRLEDITDFSKLYDLLDRHEHLRGRYIVLPNVSEGGNSTVLRAGFANRYKDMPCVGGYLDGEIGQLGNGNRGILSGKNRDYGFKALGLFQTSDNRREDFNDLGNHASWIKWAIPTAEALRQACLARETRIFHEEPQLPAIVIQSLSVSNSKFLGPVDIEFNQQFNCFIGGRGTGKSTFLEYLRWAMCDQLPVVDEDSELPQYQKKRANLIENTLIPLDAVVTVSFSLNGVQHTIRKNARTKELQLKIASEEFQLCDEEDVRNLLPIQAYSQKQLSAVGVRTDELDRFIRAEIRHQLSDFVNEEKDIKSKLQTFYMQANAKAQLHLQIGREEREIGSLNQQLKTLRDALKGLNAQDQKLLNQHDSYLQEEQFFEDISVQIKRLEEVLDDAVNAVENIDAVAFETEEPTPNHAIIQRTSQSFDKLLNEVKGHLNKAKTATDASSLLTKELITIRSEWEKLYQDHHAKYEEAKSRASAHEGRLKQISQLEEQIKQKKAGVSEKKMQAQRYGNPENDYLRIKENWKALHKKRADLLAQKCEELTMLSSGTIRAKLLRGHGLKRIQERLEGVLSGTRIRSKKAEDLCEQIRRGPDSVEKWDRIAAEIESLARIDKSIEGELQLPQCPLLSEAGFNNADLDKLARKITVEDWLQLFLTELDDIPLFEYKLGEGEYIKFSDASAGQQATALLRVLLNQEGTPLIIDQPEDDLDNQVILQIVEEIWSAKARRQIIFTSHNANIVVNGDADLVICCDYRILGEQSGGRIKCCGAIDVDEIRSEIKNVMEGGDDAFKLRKQKYGF